MVFTESGKPRFSMENGSKLEFSVAKHEPRRATWECRPHLGQCPTATDAAGQLAGPEHGDHSELGDMGVSMAMGVPHYNF